MKTKINAKRIRRALTKYGPMTRREIAEVTRLENGEVAARISEMKNSGIVVVRGQKLSPITKRLVGVVRLAKRAAA